MHFVFGAILLVAGGIALAAAVVLFVTGALDAYTPGAAPQSFRAPLVAGGIAAACLIGGMALLAH